MLTYEKLMFAFYLFMQTEKTPPHTLKHLFQCFLKDTSISRDIMHECLMQIPAPHFPYTPTLLVLTV